MRIFAAMAEEAAGFALAYDTWISQGSGLKSDRRGTMRYNKGPMRGMTRDEAMAMFRNQVWNNAAPEWKDEYARRATSGMMSPSEQAEAQRKQSQIRTMIPPRPAAPAAPASTSKPPATIGNSMVNTSSETPEQVKDRVLRQSQLPVRLDEQTPEDKAMKEMIGTAVPSVTPPKPSPVIQAGPNMVLSSQMMSNNMGAASTLAPSQPASAQATLDQARQRVEARADAAKSAASVTGIDGKPIAQTPVALPQMQPQTQPGGMPSRGSMLKSQVAAGIPIGLTRATPIEEPKPPMTAPIPVNTQQPVGTQTNDVLSNEDMSGQGYTLVGNKGGVKKWRRGADMTAANTNAANKTMANVVKSPVFNARPDAPQNAPKPKPFTTKFDVTQGRVVATGGTPDADFQRYDAAQTRLKAGQDTDEDKAVVKEYVGRDALSRTPDQIAQQKADERAGNYQAGRYVGNNRATAVREPMFRR